MCWATNPKGNDALAKTLLTDRKIGRRHRRRGDPQGKNYTSFNYRNKGNEVQ